MKTAIAVGLCLTVGLMLALAGFFDQGGQLPELDPKDYHELLSANGTVICTECKDCR